MDISEDIYWSYIFNIDKDGYLLNFYQVGSVIAYLSVCFNVLVFCLLFRKTLYSPVTILIQGLAISDCLTAMSAYGFEPYFQEHYQCERFAYDLEVWLLCDIPYPSCMIYTHASIFSMTFHLVSILLTTCLGLQKVVAVLFPIWTKINLSNRTALFCCVICFAVPICLGLPRHFTLRFINDAFCYAGVISADLLEFSSVYYLIIKTIVLICCCLVMTTCTIYIVYKLLSNKFRGHKINRQERRSVIMVVIVLLVFLLSEIPKLIMYALFTITFLSKSLFLGDNSNPSTSEYISVSLLMWFEHGMVTTLTTLNKSSSMEEEILINFLLEGTKLFTLTGCLSNFIIYVTMSKKLRDEIKETFKSALRKIMKSKFCVFVCNTL